MLNSNSTFLFDCLCVLVLSDASLFHFKVDAESQLDQVVFPVLTSDLEQKYREIKSNVLEKYR